MVDGIISAVRAVSPSMKNAIIKSCELNARERKLTVTLVTDCSFSAKEKEDVTAAVNNFVPDYFTCGVDIIKLSPDERMVARRIRDIINENFKAIAADLRDEDIEVKKSDEGFDYAVRVFPHFVSEKICNIVTAALKGSFCGEFSGRCFSNGRSATEIEVEEKPDEIEYEMPIRTFKIDKFAFLEGEKRQETAVYMADLNFSSEEVVVCGRIEGIRIKTYNKNGEEKSYLGLNLSDGTATMYTSYFIRKKTEQKIAQLKEGDYIVCTGSNEFFNGSLRFKTKTIDFGRPPEDFVPEKRASKPVPMYYHFVKPQPFNDIAQTDIFSDASVPECLKKQSFVVFDLETTGLVSSPVSGNMDKIIEIGAYKITDGQIAESFSTFINPQKKLSESIVGLTGITDEMVKNAPTYEQALPDFYKFCYGSILVGHNIVNFDFKFVDYYCGRLGYILDRKLIDTYALSQELLYLSNYKLNTVAEKFDVEFNHHRAVDDALATAKIFIELIKMKKSLPQLQ